MYKKHSISDEQKDLKDTEHRCDEGLLCPLKSDFMSFQAVHALPWKGWKDFNSACMSQTLRATAKIREKKEEYVFEQAYKPQFDQSSAGPKLRLIDRLTGVECRATSIAENCATCYIL